MVSKCGKFVSCCRMLLKNQLSVIAKQSRKCNVCRQNFHLHLLKIRGIPFKRQFYLVSIIYHLRLNNYDDCFRDSDIPLTEKFSCNTNI